MCRLFLSTHSSESNVSFWYCSVPIQHSSESSSNFSDFCSLSVTTTAVIDERRKSLCKSRVLVVIVESSSRHSLFVSFDFCGS